MAEELNSRGAMELAVPFYRQTIALLLAEREQWNGLPPLPSQRNVVDEARAVQALAGDLAAGQASCPEAPPAATLSSVELLRRVEALEEELDAANRQEVSIALEDLEQRWGEPQAQLLGLRAKLYLLEGDLASARRSLEQAHQLDPSCPRLQHNAGAACLACGDANAAVALLRPLVATDTSLQPPGARAALLNNLAQAELEVGDGERAVTALVQLLAEQPEALALEPWLSQIESWTAAGQANLSQRLIEAMLPLLEDPAVLLPLLAASHEAQGQYREAALVYRDLLRPRL